MGLSLRKQRLRLTWVLAPLFLFLANPSSGLLLAGVILSVPGLILRGMAAGTIHKDQALAVSGPYAHLRHPLYLGSFFLGLGLAVAGGRWVFLPVYLGVFMWAYGRTIRAEERGLELRFGGPFQRYRVEVPAFLPRLRPYRLSAPAVEPGGGEGVPASGFQPWLFWRNGEWATSVGVLTGLGMLWLKMVLMG